jgi:hypothetical protein
MVRATDVKAPAVRITGPSPDASFSTAVGVINLEGASEDDFGVARITWSAIAAAAASPRATNAGSSAVWRCSLAST